MTSGRTDDFSVTVTGRRWLTPGTFELRFRRPSHFSFIAGQKIGLIHGDFHRDYSLVGTPDDDELIICVRLIENGWLSPILSRARVGDAFQITPACGHFRYQAAARPAVFIATGTGVAPFVAFARGGAAGFLVLHGVRSVDERYYHGELAACARTHIACIPGIDATGLKNTYAGRVTEYLARNLVPDTYDFYLCGRTEMIRDAMRIIDRRFIDARVFTEIFF